MHRPFPLLGVLLLASACKPDPKPATGDSGDTGQGPDEDGDGYGALVDCDDSDPAIHPDAEELCDGINNDCDAAIDEPDATDTSAWYKDADLDGYGDSDVVTYSCERPPGFVADGTDCDDTADSAYPGAEEICNDGADNDCDEDPDDCTLFGAFSLKAADAALGGARSGDQAGTRIAGGDIDGNGTADLIVGVPYADVDANTDSGAVQIMYGPVSAGASLGDAAVITYDQRSSNAGDAISYAGDVNGDGYGDIFLSAPGADTAHPDSGVVFLAAGPFVGTLSVESVSIATIDGDGTYDRIGAGVVGNVDADGDGVLDVFVSTDRYSVGSDSYLGAAYLLQGPITGAFDLETYDARITGADRYDRVGDTLGGADVDGDGLDDLIVGSYSYPNNANDGMVGVFWGTPAGDLTIADADALLVSGVEDAYLGQSLSTGDVNGDGYDDLLVGSPYDTGLEEESGAVFLVYGPPASGTIQSIADVTLPGVGDDDEVGQSVACDGDFNADGRDDVLIGAPGESTVSRDAGRAYFFYGPLSGTPDLKGADIVLAGAVGRQRAGATVGLAADVNGDGLDDMAISAPEDDTAGSDAGLLYVIYGVGL